MIGPNGEPAPTEATATGGREAAGSTFGLPQYQAVLRASKRPAELRKSDTTWEKGCTPAQVGGCMYGTWYLLDTKNEKMICPDGKATAPRPKAKRRSTRTK